MSAEANTQTLIPLDSMEGKLKEIISHTHTHTKEKKTKQKKDRLPRHMLSATLKANNRTMNQIAV